MGKRKKIDDTIEVEATDVSESVSEAIEVPGEIVAEPGQWVAKDFRKPPNGNNIRGRSQPSTSRMTDAQALAIVERRYKVITMRRDGYTVPQIAQALDIAQNTVAVDIKTILVDTINHTAETAEENRQLQIERLDALLKATMPFAIDYHKEIRVDQLTGEEHVIQIPPDIRYTHTVLAIESRRAKLLALDKPEEKGVTETGIRVYVGVDYDKV